MKEKTLIRSSMLTIPLLAVGIFAFDLAFQRAEHFTPEKAQHLVDPTVGPFEMVKSPRGIVLFTLDG